MTRGTKKTEHLVKLSMFAAIALVIFIVEAQFPSPVLYIPGMKLGLANAVTLFLLSEYTKKDAFAVLMVRIFLGSFFAGQMTSLIYSLAGGILSFMVMILCIKIFGKEYIWFTGVCGGISHNIGQICAAALLMETKAVFSYLPWLILFGTGAGLFCGLSAQFLAKHTRRLKNNLKTEKKP